MAPSRLQAIIWTIVDPDHRRTYAALGGDELRSPMQLEKDCYHTAQYISIPVGHISTSIHHISAPRNSYVWLQCDTRQPRNNDHFGDVLGYNIQFNWGILCIYMWTGDYVKCM